MLSYPEETGRWHNHLPIQAYTSRTGTRETLHALRRARWRLLVSARGVLRHEGMPYALDNGAWTSFQRGEAFDESAFMRAIDRLGERADFVVVPDIVAGGMRSLEFSLRWLERLAGLGAPMAMAVQDGMTDRDVEKYLGAGRHRAQLIFVGGSTDWKLNTLGHWTALARRKHLWVHVGRVNSLRRIKYCVAHGATSFDGSGVARFPHMLDTLDACRRTGNVLEPSASAWCPKTPAEQAYWDYYDLSNAAADLAES